MIPAWEYAQSRWERPWWRASWRTICCGIGRRTRMPRHSRACRATRAAKVETQVDLTALGAFVDIAGRARWDARLADLRQAAASPSRAGQRSLQQHAIELIIDRLRAGPPDRGLNNAERRIASLAEDAVALFGDLAPEARARLVRQLGRALDGETSLVPLFHQLRRSSFRRARGL